jgi:hypothetical protein
MNIYDGGKKDSAYLFRLLQEAARDEGCALGDLTVLNLLTDPYRCATPNNLRDGAWVAEKLAITIKPKVFPPMNGQTAKALRFLGFNVRGA